MAATAEDQDIGGAPLLPLLVVGQGALARRLADDSEHGLAAGVARATDGSIEVVVTVVEPVAGQSVWDAVAALGTAVDGQRITVLSFDGDLPDRWPGREAAPVAVGEAVRALKSAGTRVVGLGVSTIDPANPRMTSTSRSAHELDLTLLELSVDEGISLLDTDRIVAELGGAAHVQGFLQYDDVVLDRLVDEMVRIIGDYGFFEARPLVPQRGTKKRR